MFASINLKIMKIFFDDIKMLTFGKAKVAKKIMLPNIQ